MPELPELETICNKLQLSIIDQQITKIIIRQKSLRWPINPNLNKILKDSIIKSISRRAKYLLINCYNINHKLNGYLIIHLGMSGKLSVVPHTTPITKHDHLDFVLKNNNIIRYNDPRRFGAIIWTTDNPLKHFLLKNLGPEPFDTLFNVKYLLEKSRNKSRAIKQLIMDHKIVVGVGNIYANEALFAAKIHPLSIATKLSSAELKILIFNIKKILKNAILQGGTTLKDFFDPNGNPGFFSQKLQIYGRHNKPCVNCNTAISTIKLGQRTTFFCNKCQKIV